MILVTYTYPPPPLKVKLDTFSLYSPIKDLCILANISAHASSKSTLYNERMYLDIKKTSFNFTAFSLTPKKKNILQNK